MKKFVAMMLALVLALSCACALADEGQVVMATNAEWVPFEMMDDAGNVIGFDADLAAEIAKDLGKELKIESMPFDSVIASVNSGSADVGISALSILPERLNYVDFSDVYYTAHQACLTKKDSGIVTLEDLQGKMIGVQGGTSGQFTAEEYTDVEKISSFQKVLDAVMELKNGKVDCVIADDHTVKAIMASLNDDTLMIADMAFPEEEYAVAVAKNQPELLASINATLARIKQDGTYDAMVQKWLGNETVADEEAPADSNN